MKSDEFQDYVHYVQIGGEGAISQDPANQIDQMSVSKFDMCIIIFVVHPVLSFLSSNSESASTHDIKEE